MITISWSFALMNGLISTLLSAEGLMITSRPAKGNLRKYALYILCLTPLISLMNLIPGVKGSYIETLIFYPIMILLFKLIFKADLFESMIRILLIIPILIIVETIAVSIYSILFGSISGLLNDEMRFFAYYFVMIGFLVPFALTSPLVKIADRFWEYIKSGSIILVNFFIYLVLAKINVAISAGSQVNNPTMQLAGILAIASGNICISIYLIANVKKQAKIKEYENLREVSGRLIDEIRSRQHDYKNHLQVMTSLLQGNDILQREKAEEYISTMSADAEYVSEIIKTKDPVLGALLYNKKNSALKQGVNFQVFGCKDEISFPMEDYELISVISNLIDNAFEAAIPGGVVRFSIGTEYGLNYMQVENTGSLPEVPANLFARGYSTKDKKRGYGLYNVKRIVTKHKGTIEATVDKGMVSFRIAFFKVPNEKATSVVGV